MTSKARRPWTERDTARLRKMADAGNTAGEIAGVLERDVRLVNERAKREGIQITRLIAPRQAWTAADDAVLQARYPHEATEAIAADLGRNERAVYQRAHALGLKKSEAYMASVDSGRIHAGWHDGRGNSTRFKPGQTSWNKGVHGITGHHPNTRRTQFRKGQMTGAAARNYQRIGTLRVNNGVLERKVTDDPSLVPARRWQAVARIVWEQANGPIPAGHAVVFKPGRATVVEEQITLDAVELVTRAELMRRNSRHTRYPPELNQLMQLKGALNRKINRRIKEQEEQP